MHYERTRAGNGCPGRALCLTHPAKLHGIDFQRTAIAYLSAGDRINASLRDSLSQPYVLLDIPDIAAITDYEMVDAIKTLSEEKHTIYEYLDLFLVWFRDVLMFKATHEIDGLVFRQEYKDIKSRADKSSYEGLENIIKAIENAKVRLQANVNFELTMELLFLTIREN